MIIKLYFNHLKRGIYFSDQTFFQWNNRILCLKIIYSLYLNVYIFINKKIIFQSFWGKYIFYIFKIDSKIQIIKYKINSLILKTEEFVTFDLTNKLLFTHYIPILRSRSIPSRLLLSCLHLLTHFDAPEMHT